MVIISPVLCLTVWLFQLQCVFNIGTSVSDFLVSCFGAALPP